LVIQLSQSEADYLFSVEKCTTTSDLIGLPSLGGSIRVPLSCKDGREEFSLDVYKNKINLSKGTFQNRVRTTIVLVRLDFGGAPHRNPDGQEIGGTHIHLYKEGYNDKWAYEIPLEHFSDVSDFWQSLQEFMKYCNITEPPQFQKGLFT
jgi:hypothetical protein